MMGIPKTLTANETFVAIGAFFVFLGFVCGIALEILFSIAKKQKANAKASRDTGTLPPTFSSSTNPPISSQSAGPGRSAAMSSIVL